MPIHSKSTALHTIYIVITFHLITTATTVHTKSHPPTLSPLTLLIIPTNPPLQSPPQNPLLRRNILFFLPSQLLMRPTNNLTLRQRLQQNIILRPREIHKTHTTAPSLLAGRVHHSVDVAPQNRSAETYQRVA